MTTVAKAAMVVVQADGWYRQLLRSREMMQQLVGGADPSSLDADWDTASVTSTEQTDQTDDKPSGWAAGQGFLTACPSYCCLPFACRASPRSRLRLRPHCNAADSSTQPQVSMHLTASLGELAIFVSGRTTEIWWPPEVHLLIWLHACAP